MSERRGTINKPSFRRQGTEEQTAVRGWKGPLQSQPTGVGTNRTILETSLIRANIPTPRQWLVTLMTPTVGNGVTPYRATFDGGAAFPPAGTFTAPTLPNPVAALMVKVLWGAGGVRFETQFDYPALGGTFSITADAMDISVLPRSNAVISYTLPNDIPVIGAFYVPGAPVDDTPMAWLETPVNIAVAASAFWSVKPFAKDVLVWLGAQDATLTWLNTQGFTVAQERIVVAAPATVQVRRDVPRQASVLQVTNNAGGIAAFLEWGIGLS